MNGHSKLCMAISARQFFNLPSRMSSAEKKRLRDRRSQQTLRDKKLQHKTQLEERVAYCERNHGDQGVQRLLQVITGLRAENKSLRNRQNELRSLIKSWDTESDTFSPDLSGGPPPCKDPSAQETPISSQQNFNGPISLNENFDIHAISTSVPSAGSPTQIQSAFNSSPAETTLLWYQIPPHSDDFSSPKGISCLWFIYPEKITPSPDIPGSPLDILYGSKVNALADMIHTALQRRPVRDPERLALGWIGYHMSRWFLNPSPATYDRLPLFIRPVQEQMEVSHPLVLDFIPWPRMRLNLIHRWHVYEANRDDLFGLFACCVKIRWPWGEDILDRDDQNELRIKKRFYDTFMSQEGWGLTPEFVERYPDLVEGMNLREITFDLL